MGGRPRLLISRRDQHRRAALDKNEGSVKGIARPWLRKREPIDTWQWMLEISSHAERHIQQIREIKADPNFPKK